MRRAALLLGQLAGVVALALLLATLYLTIGLIAGVRPESGIVGIFLIVFLGVLIALGFGAIGRSWRCAPAPARRSRRSSRSSSSSSSSPR